MTPDEVTGQLESIASDDDFSSRSAALVEEWLQNAAGPELIEPILRFMEAHRSVDFGSPDPLAHFLERFYGRGYEDKLVESIQRRPTALTAWMLNRIINGTRDVATRLGLIDVMKGARDNLLVDEETKAVIEHFVERLSG